MHGKSRLNFWTFSFLSLRVVVVFARNVKQGASCFYPKVAKCSNVDCSVTIFRNKSDKQLTDKQITELVTTGKTGLIKGFKSKNGKVFDASLAFDDQFNVTFVFPEKKGKPKK